MNIESFRIFINIFEIFLGAFCLTLCFSDSKHSDKHYTLNEPFLKIGNLILLIAFSAPHQNGLG